MSKEYKLIAKKEIFKTLKLSNFCTKKIGISFTDEETNVLSRIWTYFWFMSAVLIITLKILGQIVYVIVKLVTSASVVEFVAGLHIIGYDTMSFGKLLSLRYKRRIFSELLHELAALWPAPDHDDEAAHIKREKLSRLRIGQFGYAFWNILGVWLYNLTPLVVYVYRSAQGTPADLGYVWHLSYPFDKTRPIYHELVFVFETYAGVVSVWSMLGSDILFMTMASHISMLLRLLQLKIRRLGEQGGVDRPLKRIDCYEDVVAIIKIHQKLIKYGNNLEEAFSFVNLLNVLLSSFDICFVVFNILLDPWMAMSNKFFLGAALTQVGIICWYADDIFTASSGVAEAAYESAWYNCNVRCQRAMLILIQRSQKPLYFTALKFSSITMSTYSSILTSSYSYFALLYTMYRSD